LLAGCLIVLVAFAIYLGFHGHPEAPASHPVKKADIEKINRLVIQGPAGSVTLEKKGKDWNLTAPVQDAAEPSVPAEILRTLENFTLGEIVSENPAKYEQFGLAAGRANHLQAFAEGQPKPILDAYVGKTVGTNYKNSYFRFEGSNAVYIADDFPVYEFDRQPDAYRLVKSTAPANPPVNNAAH
jgi:hypothetical protein